MRVPLPSLLRAYLRLVGAILLVQGLLTLAALTLVGQEASDATFGYLNRDLLHGAIHVAWGAALLGVLRRGASSRTLRWAAVAFGAFYLALTVLGVVVHHPLGIYLGPYEHAFHLTIGIPALVLGAADWWFDREPASPVLSRPPANR